MNSVDGGSDSVKAVTLLWYLKLRFERGVRLSPVE
jgi:hypothetical protein